MTLSNETIQTIKSTVPVLEVHGEAITTAFYKNMFIDHPELLNIFNEVNQKQGKQQQALANMVYVAAKNIDQLETLIDNVKLVAHKHRGLGVKPEHYPIVGKYLLGGIKEVLGDAATDDIMNAWEKAYGTIAQVFMDVEQEMYENAEMQTGGWDGFKDFIVTDKVNGMEGGINSIRSFRSGDEASSALESEIYSVFVGKKAWGYGIDFQDFIINVTTA